jgi:hypothetical protein
MHSISRTAAGLTIILTALALTSFPGHLAAQGLPADTGSHTPVSLWFIGVVVLAVALAYGIMRNRNRTHAEKRTTDEATKTLYAREERDRAK